MKKILFISVGLAASFCLGYFFNILISKQSAKIITNKEPENKSKKVTGVAGIFFKCKDPNKIKEWYKTHLGFDIDQYGARFEWQEGSDTTKKGSLQWSPFSENTSYFAPSEKDFMINYRVENLAYLVSQLKKEKVIFVDSIETYDYGKFVHIMDIEGNKIELYEPNYEHGKTNK